MTGVHENPPQFHSGFVAISGPPNAGKSTLLNRILGEKISITSRKPQTTRNRVLGIVNRPTSQIMFVDTPGVHQAKGQLNQRIVDSALGVLGDVDLILLLLDGAEPDPTSEAILVAALKKQSRPVLLALNKSDRISQDRIRSRLEALRAEFPFSGAVAVSARHGEGVPELIERIESLLPEGPAYYPQDDLTDLPLRFLVAERIREKIFRLTGREIPYAVAVTLESFREDPEAGRTVIHATIHVERESQKGIVIGKGGQKLRQIGEDARIDIETMLDCKVFLKLFVHVQKNWSKDPRALKRFGYE